MPGTTELAAGDLDDAQRIKLLNQVNRKNLSVSTRVITDWLGWLSNTTTNGYKVRKTKHGHTIREFPFSD